MENKYQLVILDDDLFYGNLVKYFFQNQGYSDVSFFEDESTCLNYVSIQPTLYIIDHFLKQKTGLIMMQEICEKNPNAFFIYLSNQESSGVAIKAMKLGAIDYVQKDKNSFFHLLNIVNLFFGEKSINHEFQKNIS
jgi:ActR/RegA family two-component response regulator